MPVHPRAEYNRSDVPAEPPSGMPAPAECLEVRAGGRSLPVMECLLHNKILPNDSNLVQYGS
jgi:hypothetical protein